MSPAFVGFGGARAVEDAAGSGAGCGLEATDELSQPAAASANAATKNRFALLFMVNPLRVRFSGCGTGAALMADSSILFPKASETESAAECNRRDTIRFETSRRQCEFWRGRPCRRAPCRRGY